MMVMTGVSCHSNGDDDRCVMMMMMMMIGAS